MKGSFAALLTGLLGCGGNPLRLRTTTLNSTPSSASGFVSTVQLNHAATSQGSNSPVTMVTFLLPGPQTGLAETIAFCGSVGNQFAFNGLMNVSFTQGGTCATIVSASPM